MSTTDEPDIEQVPDLGWHVISGEHFLDCLRRCEEGESADMVFAELWANSEHVENDE